MKKLLLFLLLFGSGLALLHWLDRGTAVDPHPGDDPGSEVAAAPTTPGEAGGITLGGAFESNVYDAETGLARLLIRSEDSVSRGREDELLDVTIDLLDIAERLSVAERTAGRITAASTRIERLAGGEALKPVYAKELTLRAVQADFPERLGLHDVHIESASMDLDARDPERLLLSFAELVTIDSAELEGRGRRAQILVPPPASQRAAPAAGDPAGEQVLEFQRDGWMRFASPDPGRQARPTTEVTFEAVADGPLQLTRSPADGVRSYTLEGWRGARLSVRGGDDSVLEAAHVRVQALELSGRERLVLSSVRADGDVRWRYRDHEFAAERITLHFDGDGAFVGASLEEYPSARLSVRIDPEELEVQPLAEGRQERVHVSSDTSIELERVGERIAYRVAGPATVESDRLSLRSNGELTGSLPVDESVADEEARRIRFEGDGGVVVELLSENELDPARLETAGLELVVHPAEGDAPRRLRLSTARGAKFSGQLADGRPFSVTTPDSLEIERMGEALRVVRAVDVDVAVGVPAVSGDERPHYRAVAALLEDYDPESGSFAARGDVVVTGSQGTVTGDRLVRLAARSFEVWGTPAEPAVVTSAFGRAAAQHMRADEGLLEADGDVSASVVGLPGDEARSIDAALERYDITCQHLELHRHVERAQRTLVMVAQDEVWCEWVGSERFIELHHADRLEVTRSEHFGPDGAAQPALVHQTQASARGDVRTRLALPAGDVELACHTLDLQRRRESGSENLEQEVLARGDVRFDGNWLQAEPLGERALPRGTREVAFAGRAAILRIDPDGTATLEDAERGRIDLHGSLPIRGTAFQMRAERASFSAERLEAVDPDLTIEPAGYRARAQRMLATRSSIELEGDAHLDGHTSKAERWDLFAGSIRILAAPASEAQRAAGAPQLTLTEVRAANDVAFTLGELVRAAGEELLRNSLGIRLSGGPATIEMGGFAIESEWIEFDPDLQLVTGSGPGRGRPGAAGDGGPFGPQADQESSSPWTLTWLSQKAEIDQDQLVFFLEAPYFVHEPTRASLRASWSVVWIDRARWRSMTEEDQSLLGRTEGAGGASTADYLQASGPMKVFFQFLEANGISDLVHEAYFEGPVEVYSGEDQVARADAVYFDLASKHGWLANATVNVVGSLVAKKLERLSVHADWLRHSADGSLRADDATVTPCDYDLPHVRIVTGDLRLTPLERVDPETEEAGYEVSLRDNRIELFDLLTIPLPPIGVDTDEDLKPRLPSFRFGNSARFGQLLSFRFTRQANQLGQYVHSLFARDDDGDSPGAEASGEGEEPSKRPPYVARYDVDASYLGSRGGLLDLGFTVRSRLQRYWLELVSGVILDTGRDKGYLQVPEDERDDLRLWLRGQGQLDLGSSELRFSYSDQSDPAVQSEFYEGDFVTYEQDETYLQWKRAEGRTWTQASVQVRVDEFRAGVEELPSLSAFVSRAPLTTIGKVPVIHRGDLRAAYLRRRSPARFDLNGDGFDEATLTSPFQSNGIYPDGNTAQEVLRLDTTQTVDFPIGLGTYGLQFIPFARVRGTFWDDAIGESEASRVVAEAGARLSTLLWRQREPGVYDQIAPYIEYRNDLERNTDGTPYVFDGTETALFGDFVQVGTRTRLAASADRTFLDLDVKGTFAANRSDGRRDGWLPIEVFGRMGIEPRGHRFDIWYDGRFDVEHGETAFSLFSLGTRLSDRVGVQVGYHYGRDSDRIKVFDAASVSGFYRWTDKWEFEGQQTFSLLEDEALGFGLILRRYGHDLIFELESEVREGEGSSVSFSVRPVLGFKPNRIGYINW